MKAITKHLIPNAGTLVLVGLLFLAQAAGAIPSVAPAQPLAPSQTLISYQGTLTDPDGNSIDGPVTMEFALYDAASTGNLLWGPETQSVEVSEGLFHVLLGRVVAIDPDALSGDLYLDIKVNGEPMLPRELITSIAYAVEAGTLPAGATTRGSLTVNGPLSTQGTSGTLRLHANPDGGDFNIFHTEEGTKELSIFGSGISATMDVEVYDGNLTLSAGDLDMNGNSVINCGALTEANLQTAVERMADGSDRFEEGDVLCWGDGQLEKCTQAGDPLVQAVADAAGRPIVIGAERVKVIGPVKKGDFLVASEVPGYAMAADNPAFGTVIAQALEDLEGGKGLVKAMIRKF
jgi:hypothetical protein